MTGRALSPESIGGTSATENEQIEQFAIGSAHAVSGERATPTGFTGS